MPFKDNQISFADYGAAKKEGKYPAGLPVLKTTMTPSTDDSGKEGVVEYTQSLSIAPFAGKLAQQSSDLSVANLYPSDPVQSMAVDQTLDIAQDIATKCPVHQEKEEMKRLRDEFFGKEHGKGYALFGQLQDVIQRSDGLFVNGDLLSIADLHVCFFLTSGIESGQWDFVATTYIHENFPGISNLGKAVREHPMVVNYYSRFETSRNNEF
jgi:glutathione S-transferase